MATPTRLANKTIWSLERIVNLSRDARRSWGICQERAQRTMDPILFMALGELSDKLAQIEAEARDARTGTYHDQ